jgi:hypothetical protein
MKAKAFLIGLMMGVSMLGSAQAAATYDAAADFSSSSNTSSNVWSYGFTTSLADGYGVVLFDTFSQMGSLSVWSSSTHNVLGAPAAWIDANAASEQRFAMHPGPNAGADSAVLRFTAPTSGTYTVDGRFFAGDFGAMSGSVVLGGLLSNPLFQIGSTTDAASSAFSFATLTLAQGQTLDFLVGNNGSFFGGSTPLSVSITQSVSSVPEPTSLALLLAGGVVLLVLRRRA